MRGIQAEGDSNAAALAGCRLSKRSEGMFGLFCAVGQRAANDRFPEPDGASQVAFEVAFP